MPGPYPSTFVTVPLEERELRRRFFLLPIATRALVMSGASHWQVVEVFPCGRDQYDRALVYAEDDHYILVGPRTTDPTDKVDLVNLRRHMPPGEWYCEFASAHPSPPHSVGIWVTDIYLDNTSELTA